MLRSCCYLILCSSLLTISWATRAQTIQDANGAPLKTKWCDVDSSYLIVGTPSGGTFSGCGVFQQNGNWYFNPATATTGITVFPTQCSLIYTTASGSVSQNMLVYKPVVPDVGPDQITCNKDTFSLSVKTLYAGAYNYDWTPSAGLFSPTAQTTKGSITTTTTYIVSAQDVSSGCMGFDTVTIVNRQPNLQMVTATDTVCARRPLQLLAVNPESGASYTWQFEMGATATGTNVTHTYEAAGNYTIVLQAQNEYCSGSISKSITVQDFKLKLTASDPGFDRGTSVTLQANASVPFNVSGWSPVNFFPSQHAKQQTIFPDTSHIFTVIAQSEFGCIDTANLFVPVNPVVFVPSAFSPNGDGMNDLFHFKKWGEPVLIEYFAVYNRWGQCMWKQQGGEAEFGWDGNFNGKPAPVDTYYYILKLATNYAHAIEQKGDVSLIR
ncbi:T9SS type B sorting domain-containing protein [Taibaiella soli]|uniref:PKD domain-containing protein n=1 Tax=Taibaiella soli TaxID=1649169 RepID=A0A2W2ANS6_9BACT|nr:gliding motility-associated C-terminal domain-containing protein [Taibaiella soli]PZF74020.1 hypothetical protein DN068_04805 [Taibaiella soli]